VAYEMLASGDGLPVIMKSLLLGSCFSIAMILLINFFYKVSVHTAAAVILTGVTIVLNVALRRATPLLLPLALFIAVLVGMIRWFLGAHTLGQILLGYLVGVLCQVGGFFLLTHNTFLARILLLS
jgi:membrane-associated phospholipid phosphatase